MWTPKKFLKNEDGNVAMMFAGTVVMLLIGTGVAVDFSNASRLKNELQAQVDASVLAAATADISGVNTNGVGRRRAQEEQIRTEAALSVISANGFEDSHARPEIDVTDSTVIVRAEVEYRPFFGRLLGRETMTLSAESESGFGAMSTVEIVMVLDNTDSMRVDGKMEALKEGARSLVDAIEESDSDSKIGLVPFSRYVRLNDSVRTKSWFDMPDEYDTVRTHQQATHTGGTCRRVTDTREIDGVTEQFERNECTGQTTTYEEETNVLESRWEGCVGTRPPPYSERDDSYTVKIPGLLNRIPKEVSGLRRDERTSCPSEIVPLSDDYANLRSEINGLSTTDNTYIPSGLIWGQRVLSPGEPFDNTPVSGGAEVRKIMVLMTDGENTTTVRTGSAHAANLDTSPYIDSLDDNESPFNSNAATTRMCDNVKADDVEIYTIAFRVTDSTTKTLLRNCASHPSKAFTPDSNAALVNEFKRLSDSLAQEVRLIR